MWCLCCSLKICDTLREKLPSFSASAKTQHGFLSVIFRAPFDVTGGHLPQEQTRTTSTRDYLLIPPADG